MANGVVLPIYTVPGVLKRDYEGLGTVAQTALGGWEILCRQELVQYEMAVARNGGWKLSDQDGYG